MVFSAVCGLLKIWPSSPDPTRLHPLIAASGIDILRAHFLGSTDCLEVPGGSSKWKPGGPVTPLLQPAGPERTGKLALSVGQFNGESDGQPGGFGCPTDSTRPAAVELAQEALMGKRSGAPPDCFCKQLVEMFRKRVKYTQRHTGPAGRPDGNPQRKRGGVLPDLAWLMIEACRCVGLPARFVSWLPTW